MSPLPASPSIDADLPAGLGADALAAAFVTGIADIAYMKGLDGRYRMVNEACALFLGKAASEIVGTDDSAIFPADMARKFVDQDRAVLASGMALTFEDEVPGHRKTAFLQTVKSVCRDARGKVIGTVGISRNIDERKKLELALRRRERELADAQRIARIGTWRWERATDTVTWSDEIYRIFEYDRSRPPQNYRQLLEMEGPPSLRKLVAAFDRAVRLGEPYSLDMQVPLADGAVRWIAARGEVETWENGEVASLCGTVHEITERKRHEEELALSETRYRSLAHATSQIVWVVDATGRQMGCVPEWEAFTGQTIEEQDQAGADPPDQQPMQRRQPVLGHRCGTLLTRTAP